MRRAVVTGLGFITSIGNGRDEVLKSLRESRNGIEFFPDLDRPNVPVRLAGTVKGFTFSEPRPENWELPDGVDIPREQLRSMAPNCVYAWCAMREAIADAGLTPDLVSNPRTGAMCASAGSGWLTYEFLEVMVKRGVQRCYPLGMIASIAGTVNMNMVASFGIKGASLGFSSACASSAHAFGAAIDHIRLGRQDIVFVVGAEDCTYYNVTPFAGMRALTTQTDGERFPCAFGKNRDGFAVTGGATVLVVEELEHAQKRGAKIYAEAIGWGEASDGYSVSAPEPEGDGLARAIHNALGDTQLDPENVDYINAHATGTPVGDVAEIKAIKKIWPGRTPLISSTKSITGHGLSLAGAMEAGFCCLALSEGFVPVSAKISELDPACDGARIVTAPVDAKPATALSNSSGFGGTNVVLALHRWAAS
jgi:3-oxoacyl-[acyl-carrier-protein] synthase-1